VPIPHPFIGLILDPFDYAPYVGSTVSVNGLPRCQAGTGGYALPPHIPIGGVFVKPPGNECEAFMGSSTVLADGEPLTYLGLPALSCSDVGMPPPPRAGKKGAPKSMALPTSVVLAIPLGAPVLVGGAPTISMTAMAFKAALAGLGKLKALASRSKRMKALAARMHRRAAKVMDRLGVPTSWRNRVHRAICAVTGHPVDVATGKLFTESPDFELPGPIPLRWRRLWLSTSVYAGPLGLGWHHDYDLALIEDRELDVVGIRLADGRGLACPRLPIGGSYFDRAERVTVLRDQRGYGMWTLERHCYRFGPAGSGGDVQRLVAIEDVHGNAIRFEYDAGDRLVRIIDSAGRTLNLSHDDDGRIVEIRAPHPDDPSREFSAMRYAYDRGGRMTEAHDALARRHAYGWQGPLLVTEQGPSGLQFDFEWDGTGPEARCVRTWGSARLLDRRIRYLDGLTEVEDSGGAITRYQVADGLAIAITDPCGGVWQREYTEFSQIAALIDPLGRRREFDYDERGNLIAVREPDGSSMLLAWSERDELLRVIDRNGGWWQWRYDQRQRVVERLDPAGGRQLWSYEGGWLTGIGDPLGNLTSFGWDQHGNVTGIRSATGATERWRYDALGRPIEYIDARGGVEQRSYDLRGQLIAVTNPEGRVASARYDAQGNLIEAKVGEFNARFEYVGTGKLARRTVGEQRLSFVYDLEERLREVVDATGQRHRFELDPNGAVIGETDFGGRTLRYRRDAAGRMIERTNGSGQTTNFEYDPCGRVIRKTLGDGSVHRFRYRGDGRMIAADNGVAALELELDPFGRVLVERQGEHWVASEYDAAGRRTRVRSSLGGETRLLRDRGGAVIRLDHHDGARAWVCEFERDLQGLERERRMPGGVTSSWQHDLLGRPQRHELRGADGEQLIRSYTWAGGDRLAAIDDALLGSESFGHDALGAVVWARRGHDFELRLRDACRNLFESEDRGARGYGPGGELLRDGTSTRRYDADGRLIEKRRADGATWAYEWDAADQLRAVIRPDGRRVEFAYDALGRRIEKRFDGIVTRYLWNGSTLLHEWREGEVAELPGPFAKIVERPPARALLSASNRPRGPPRAITWVHEGGFAPIARLEAGGAALAIVCDHRSAPLHAYDEDGRRCWSARLDLAGRLHVVPAAANQDPDPEQARATIPFRFAGQYEDVETGLYYNRFRYYDPEASAYLSPDPAGLFGGLSRYAFVNDPHARWDPFGLNPSDIALGLQMTKKTFEIPGMPPIVGTDPEALDKFAANPAGDGSVKATSWRGFDNVQGVPDAELGPHIQKAMNDAERIHFNLEGMNNVDDIARSPDPKLFKPPSTNWELATVLSDPDLKKKTTFYDGPGKVRPCPG
ncbi:MAG TPA: DUF6531 domain-containing protein, partial [Enhygromyxa sp.]|nr:DUF6531 domain-containing protein [Enhygromyxa sp.]